MQKILIIHKDFAAEIETNDSKTALAVLAALPFSGSAQVWKEEVYFETPVTKDLEDSTEKVRKGDVAYWPHGKALCIFFGKSQPISGVNIVGRVVTNLDGFKEVADGDDLSLKEM
jgi:hypothetical protein